MSDPKKPSSTRSPISRRAALLGVGAVPAALVVACDDGTTTTGTGAGGEASSSTKQGSTSGNGSSTNSSASGTSSDSSSSGGGDVCKDVSSLTPEALLAPIQTIVVLCMENRSFDHFLGSLKLVEGRDIDGLVGTESNPDSSGGTVPIHQLDDFTPEDPPHGWDAAHAQFNGGANDGFVTEHEGASESDVMGYHVRAQLPVTYALADANAVCDRWFASVMGPTWPNRFYLHAATSNGNQGNSPTAGLTTIWNKLDDKGVSNANYYHDVAWCIGGYAKFGGLRTIEKFFEDAAAGTLPAYSLIDPQYFGSGANDDHPAHDIQLGQALMSAVYKALAASPQWSSCLFIITNDEHGGFFDHVAPPTTADQRPEFQQLGFRVPTIVCGPFVKSGCTVSTQFEHVSILKTLTVRFGLESLNARLDAANDLSSAIDPAKFGAPSPPVQLPIVDVSLQAATTRVTRNNHPELARTLAETGAPPSLDRRGDSAGITRRWLEAAERVGAVRLRP